MNREHPRSKPSTSGEVFPLQALTRNPIWKNDRANYRPLVSNKLSNIRAWFWSWGCLVTEEVNDPLVCKVGCTSRCLVTNSPGFDSKFVVDRYSQTLPATNIAFSGLHRDMPEEKLDLFKLASRIMAEPRTGPAQKREPSFRRPLMR